MPAFAGMLSVFRFRQLSARGTDKNITGMSCITGEQVPREEVNNFATLLAWYGFDPEKILHMGLSAPAEDTACSVQLADIFLQSITEGSCCFVIGG